MMSDFNAIEFRANKLILLDQTKLPFKEEYIETDDYERIAVAIERLEVRGAPAIGITAAYALAIALLDKSADRSAEFSRVFERLSRTRPTAVNLFWALHRLKAIYEENKESADIGLRLLEEAKKIHSEDIQMCDAIGKNGFEIFKAPSSILTHCNTGKLATGGEGTAFNVIKNAHKNGMLKHVYADETRPLLQGSRLTAFELSKAGIPFSINVDSASAFMMQKGLVDAVIVGADRISLNGDTANKIGTYSLAVLCSFHNIPFYIAAPSSTIDKKCLTGEDIKIEFRGREELNSFGSAPITSVDYDAYSPAFDVTPNNFIRGIITEIELFRPPYNFSSIKN